MPEYLAPGVFVEEIDSGSKPIEGVGTNTTAFIGYAKSGVFNKPFFISNWSQFCEEFGEEEGIVLKALASELGKSAVELTAKKRAQKPKKGWLAFAQQEIRAAGKDWAKFMRDYNIPQASAPYLTDSYLAHAVKGYFDNGGGRAYIVRIPRTDDISLFQSAGAKSVSQVAHREICGYALKALTAGASGNEIKIELEPVGEGDEFRAKISQGSKEESFGFGKNEKPLTPGGFAAAINAKSKLVSVDEASVATATRPTEAITINLEGGADAATSGTELVLRSPSVSDLITLTPDDFVGDEAKRTGAEGLSVVEDVNMICMPDLMAGVWQRDDTGEELLMLDEKRKQAILDAQCQLVAYCERSGDRMAILDPIPGLTPQEMASTTLATAYNCDHGQAALYYPWVRIPDPSDRERKRQMFVPPSGHIAGVWARVVSERGVHKAPANEAMLGVVALETNITKGEQEILNPIGVNCIRTFPGTGIRVWGARTLATVGNPSWKYINVRRLFNYLEKSMERGMQWVVFEPNDSDLWGRVRRNLSAFLWTEWKEGKLFGSVPSEAFYVKCDAETNPQEMIDLGRLYVEIGINPVKPAEFVIVRIGQWSGSSSVSES